MNIGRKPKVPQTAAPAAINESDITWDAAPAAAPVAEADITWDKPAEEAPKTSGVWAGVRGALQGLTLGYSDEIAGAIDSAFGSETYEQARDRIRAKNAAHKADHPVTYTGGEIAGGVAASFAPGLNAGKAASVARIAGKSALQGGLQSAGTSEATTAEGVLGDAIKGGVVGGVVGGALGKAGKLLTGSKVAASGATQAEEQAGKMLVGEALEGATATAKKRVVGAASGAGMKAKAEFAGDLILSDPMLQKAATKSASKLETALGLRVSEVGEKLAPHYDEVDKVTGGVRIGDVADALNRRIDDLAGEVGTLTQRKALEEVRLDFVQAAAKKLGITLDETTAEAFANTRVPTTQLRKLVTAEQNVASATLGGLNETTAAPIKKMVAQDVKSVLDNYLDEAASASPQAKAAIEAIRDLNGQYSTLKSMKNAVAGRVQKEVTGTKSFTDTMKAASTGRDAPLGVAMSVATGNPAPIIGLVGTKLAMPVLEAAGKYGVIQRALLARAAREGKTGAVLVQELIESGVPRGVATAAVAAASGQGNNDDASPTATDL